MDSSNKNLYESIVTWFESVDEDLRKFSEKQKLKWKEEGKKWQNGRKRIRQSVSHDSLWVIETPYGYYAINTDDATMAKMNPKEVSHAK